MTEMQLIKIIYMMRFVLMAMGIITVMAAADRIIGLVRFLKHNVRRKGTAVQPAGSRAA